MNALARIAAEIFSWALPAAAFSSLTRGMALFLAGLLVTSLVKTLRPAHRAAIWLVVIAGTALFSVVWVAKPSAVLGLPTVHSGLLSRAPAILQAAPAPSNAAAPTGKEPMSRPGAAAADPVPGFGVRLMPIAAGFLWLAGALLLVIRFLSGAVGARMLLGGCSRAPSLESLASELCGPPAPAAPIQVWTSRECGIPFTFGCRRPRIVVPEGFAEWASWKQRAVLLHELEHIRRRDGAANLVSALICSVLWFVPTVWIARRFFVGEAEAACDLRVLQGGIPGTDYADGILELLRGSVGRLLIPHSYSSLGGTNRIRERFRTILAWRPGQTSLTRRAGRAIALAFCLLLPLVSLAGVDIVPGEAVSPAPNLFVAAARGTPEQVRAALRAGAAVNQRAPGAGHTPLMVAAKTNTNPDVIRVLVDAGARIDMREIFCGATALLIAANFNPNPEITAALLEAGANPDERDNAGYSAFMGAVGNPNPRIIVPLLKAGADINGTLIDGTTALMYAATYRGNVGYIKMLLESGANGKLRSHAGNTAFDLAARNPKLAGTDALKLLEQAQF
jgi:beta-lactamase regulating signal transducer with metallopeptidase domain